MVLFTLNIKNSILHINKIKFNHLSPIELNSPKQLQIQIEYIRKHPYTDVMFCF